MQIHEVVTTVGSEQEAMMLAERVILQQLAACAQLDAPITSIYRWKGKVETSCEYRISLKVSPSKLEELISWLKSNHPYELPQLIIRSVEASDDYGAWVCFGEE